MSEPTDKDYVAKAKELYGSSDIEIDDDAMVAGAENGAWVAAWVRVPDSAFGPATPDIAELHKLAGDDQGEKGE